MLPPGLLLAGRYLLNELVGAGSMGAVYRAQDENLGEAVAVKALRAESGWDQEARRRFRNEVMVARRVVHRNVVQIRDFGEHQGVSYLVMDFVPGRSLRDLLRERGPLPQSAALAIARSVAEGLGEAHRQGVVHRDLKPANILLNTTGEALVSDFGVARSMTTALTRTGEILGTPDYLSPEQASGQPVDPRSDIYALGILMVEMLSGKTPFAGGSMVEVLAQHMSGRIQDLRGLLPDLDPRVTAVLSRCLEKDPDRRYPTTTELVADLDSLPRPWRWPSPRRALPWLALAAALVAAAGVGVWAVRRQSPVAAPAPAAIATPVGPRHAVAVLPVVAEFQSPGLEWARAGVSEMLTSSLAENAGLRVIDSARVAGLLRDLGLAPERLGEPELRQLADLLGADRLVVGHLRQSGEVVRLDGKIFAAELPPGTSQQSLSAQQGGAGDVFAMVERFGEEVRAELEVARTAAPKSSPQISAAAMVPYSEGIRLLYEGQAVRAVAPLEEAVERDPGYTAAWLKLGHAYDETGRTEDALVATRQAIGLLGGGGGRLALEAKALEALLLGDAEAAVRGWEDLAATHPNDSEIQVELARVLGRQGAFDKAVAVLKDVLALDPNHPRAWFLLGKSAIQAGDAESAANDYLVRALVVAKKLRSEQGQAEAHNATGVAYERLGRPQEAAESYATAAALRRRIGDDRGLASTLLNLGMMALASGDLATAETNFGEALAIHQRLGNQAGTAELFNAFGLLEEERGLSSAALPHYLKALEIRKTLGDERAEAEGYTNVGYGYFLLGQYQNAVVFHRQALELYLRNADRYGALQARQNIGSCELALGEWQDATKGFLQALEESRTLGVKSATAVSRGHLGRLAHLQGRYAAAFTAYREALALLAELDDRRGLVEFTLAEVEGQLELGLTAAAKAGLERVSAWQAESSNREQRARFLLLQAEWLRSQGQAFAASAMLEQALLEAQASNSPPVLLRARLSAAAAAGDRAELQAVHRAAVALGDAPLLLRSGEESAAAELETGSAARAEATLRDALRVAEHSGSYARAFRLYLLQARALEARGAQMEAQQQRARAATAAAEIRAGLEAEQRALFDRQNQMALHAPRAR